MDTPGTPVPMLSLHPGERRRLIVVLGGVAMLLVVAVVYAAAIHAPFLWDDHTLVEQESAPFRTTSLHALFSQPFWPDTSASDGHVPYYRPLTLLSYRFDIALGGAADQFHFTNIALHLVAVALLAVTAVRLGASGRAGVVGALLWALAPRLTESVAWISGRTDVLAAVFGLGALAISPATKVGADGADGADGARPSAWRIVLSASLLLGALFAKEVGLAFAAVLLVASVRGQRPRASKLVLGASAVIPVLLYGGLRWFAMRRHGSFRSFELSPQLRGLTVLETIGRYAEMTLDAVRPRTSMGFIGEPDLGRVALGVGVLALGGTAVVLFRRRFLREGIVLGALLGLFAIAPVLHVAPLNLSGAVTADRLLYVPLAGLALALAVAARGLPRRSIVTASVVALGAGLLLAGATKARLDDYGSEARFWLAAAEHAHAHNVSPRNGLAGVIVHTDEIGTACRLYDASRAILAANGRTSTPAYRRTRENLAACWAREGRYTNALGLTEDLASEFPSSGRILLALGYARLHLLDFDGSARAWRQAEVLDPGLRSIVRGELADLVSARTDAVRFADPTAPGIDAWRYADFVAGLGRLPEADLAFSQVANDPASTDVARRGATRFLVRYGRIAAGTRALEQWKELASSDLELIQLRAVLRSRTLEQAGVTALKQRIELLAQTGQQPAERAPGQMGSTR